MVSEIARRWCSPTASAPRRSRSASRASAMSNTRCPIGASGASPRPTIRCTPAAGRQRPGGRPVVPARAERRGEVVDRHRDRVELHHRQSGRRRRGARHRRALRAPGSARGGVRRQPAARATTWSAIQHWPTTATARDADASDPGDWVTTAEANNSNSIFYQCGFYQCGHRQYARGQLVARHADVRTRSRAITNNGVGMAERRPQCARAAGARAGQMRRLRLRHHCRDALGGRASVPGVPTNANAARVINMSLGGDGDCIAGVSGRGESDHRGRHGHRRCRGQHVGHAAGSPANCAGVIAVAGLRHVGTKVGFSNLGPDVAISAPGGNCVNTAAGLAVPVPDPDHVEFRHDDAGSSIYTDSYNSSLGTSFSAPLVAGTVGTDAVGAADADAVPGRGSCCRRPRARSRRPAATTATARAVPQCTAPQSRQPGQSDRPGAVLLHDRHLRRRHARCGRRRSRRGDRRARGRRAGGRTWWEPRRIRRSGWGITISPPGRRHLSRPGSPTMPTARRGGCR